MLLNRASQQVFICLCEGVSYLKPLILKYLLDGHPLLTVNEACLIHHAKGAITDHLDISVGHLLRAIRALARGGNHCGHLPTVSYNTFETVDPIRSDCSLSVNGQICTRKFWSGRCSCSNYIHSAMLFSKINIFLPICHIQGILIQNNVKEIYSHIMIKKGHIPTVSITVTAKFLAV